MREMRAPLEILISILILAVCVSGESTDDDLRIVFLERGRRGIVPIPPIPSHAKISPENTDAAYWYFPRSGSEALLISYFLGLIGPQNGIPKGVYDIDEDFSLVIENVTDSDEGKYTVRIKPMYGMVLNAVVVTVKVKVSSMESFPRVVEYDSPTAEINPLSDADTKLFSLTCTVENVKPPVQLRWCRLLVDNNCYLEYLNVTESVQHIIQPENSTGSSSVNNTYTCTATINLQSASLRENKIGLGYRCIAQGIAMEDKNRNDVTVLTTRQPITEEPKRKLVTDGTPTENMNMDKDIVVDKDPILSTHRPMCFSSFHFVGMGVAITVLNGVILVVVIIRMKQKRCRRSVYSSKNTDRYETVSAECVKISNA